MAGRWTLVSAGLKGRRRGGPARHVLRARPRRPGDLGRPLGHRPGSPPGRRRRADDANVAHLVVSGEDAALVQAATDPGFTATAGPFGVTDVVLRLGGRDEDTSTHAARRPGHRGRPASPAHRTLARPGRDDEVVLDRSAAVELGLGPGDQVTFSRGDRAATFTLVGMRHRPDRLRLPAVRPRSGPSSAPSGLERLGGAQYARLLARLPDASQADAAAARLLTTMPGVASTESWPDTTGRPARRRPPLRSLRDGVRSVRAGRRLHRGRWVDGGADDGPPTRDRPAGGGGLHQPAGDASPCWCEHLAGRLRRRGARVDLGRLPGPGAADRRGRRRRALVTVLVAANPGRHLGGVRRHPRRDDRRAGLAGRSTGRSATSSATSRRSVSPGSPDAPPGLPRVLATLGVKEAAARPARSLLAALAVAASRW